MAPQLKKRILITGGTGFVGANLVRHLLRDSHDVHLLVRPGHDPWRIEAIRPQVHLHAADLEDAESLARLVRKISPHWIFHLAAYGAYPSQSDLSQMVRTNIVGTMNLVNAGCEAGCEAFINTGSSSEYGFKDHPPSETDRLDPNSHYAVTKASATLFCQHTARARGIHLPTLRLYSVYGAYEEPTRLIPALITQGLDKKLPPLVDPDVARDFVHVDDVCEACLLAAVRQDGDPGEVYNVGSGVQTSLREVVSVARRLMHIPEEPNWGSMPNRKWDTTSWVSNREKIKRQLGWTPRISFEHGFGQTAEWLRNAPDLLRFYRTR